MPFEHAEATLTTDQKLPGFDLHAARQSATSLVTVDKKHFESNELPHLNRSRSLPSEKGTVNYLEDLAITQTMFENGTLICQGEVMDFINVIRKNRNSI